MKIKYKNIAILLLISLLAFSCANDDRPGDSQLDYNEPVKTTLDTWIATTYLNPYNINVQYKWNQNTVDNSRFLFPPTVDKVQPALEIVETIWLKSYAALGGSDFLKKIAPR